MKKNNMYLDALVGLLIINLITYIPIIGGLGSAIILFYGLGLMLELIKSTTKK